MNNIYLKIKKAKRKRTWGRNCFFGNPDLTNEMIKDTYDDEIFLAQFNLEIYRRIYNTPLVPKKGLISFFIRLKDMVPIVRYHEDSEFNEENDVRVDFNNIVESEYDLNTEYQVKFVRFKSKCHSRFLWDNSNYTELNENEIILFLYDSRDCKFLNDTSIRLLFIIDKNDLLNRDYSKVRLVIIH